tara:strand:- start:1088 stop:1690 length:603 start_codon:yes stop_codon:yes gene_type:complete
MAILDFPDVSPDTGTTLSLISNSTSFESELSNAVQTGKFLGDQWSAVMPFTNREKLQGRTIKAFLTRLGGMAGRFRMTPPDLDQLGSALGSGVIAGAGQTGTTITTSGWAANQPVLFAVGDYVEFNGELKTIVIPAFSDGSGNSTLEIAPPLRKATSDLDPIETVNPQAIFMLTNDNQASWDLQSNFVFGATIDCIEDVT